MAEPSLGGVLYDSFFIFALAVLINLTFSETIPVFIEMQGLIFQIDKIVEHQSCRLSLIGTIQIQKSVFLIEEFCCTIGIHCEKSAACLIVRNKIPLHEVQ